jgi:hypothetical protein
VRDVLLSGISVTGIQVGVLDSEIVWFQYHPPCNTNGPIKDIICTEPCALRVNWPTEPRGRDSEDKLLRCWSLSIFRNVTLGLSIPTSLVTVALLFVSCLGNMRSFG